MTDRPATPARIAPLAGGGRVDRIRGEVVRDGAVVAALTTRDLELLTYFLDRPGQDVSRDQIAEEVLGQAPGVVSRAVDSAVFRLRSRIEVDPTDPVQIVTIQGVGYRWIPAQPLRPPSNVPLPRDALIGREQELEDLWTGSAPTVALVGPPGIGKSALALTAAHRWDGDGGAVWVDLGAADGPARVAEAVGRALDLPAEVDLEAAIGWALSHRGRVLLALDDADRAASDLPPMIARWSAQAPEARFLVTSRAALGGAEEARPVDALTRLAGRELFVARARAVREFQPDDAELAVVDQLVEALDGIPLAIELAASRVGALRPAHLLERLSERLRLLARPGRDRQATLRAAIEQSWSVLSPSERSLFAGMSVFEGPVEGPVAAAVCGGPGLEELVRRSLVARSPDGRYRMLATLRAYGDEQLDPDERTRIRLRHADWFTRDALALPDAVVGPEGSAIAARSRDEGAELRAVVQRFLDPDPVRAALALIGLRPGLLRTHTDPELDEQMFGLPDRLPRSAPAALQFAVQRMVSYAHRRRGRYAEAEAAIGSATALAGSARERARCAADRLALATAAGRTAEAVELGQEALTLAEEVGWTDLVATILSDRGIALKQLGRVDEARASYERGLELVSRSGAVQVRALLVGNLAVLEAEQGRSEAARGRFEEAARLHRQLGNARSAGVNLLNLGQLMDEVGEPEAALAAALDALDIMQATGSRRIEGIARANVGGMLSRAGRHADGLQQLVQALDIATAIGQPRDAAVARAEIGLVAWAQGRLELAAAELRAGADGGPGPRNEAVYRACLGGVLGALGRPEEGVAEVARARALAVTVGDPSAVAVCDWMERIATGRRDEPARAAGPRGWQLRYAEARWRDR